MSDEPEEVTTFPFTKIVGREHIRFGRNVVIDDFVLIHATDEHLLDDYAHIASFTSITGGGRFYMHPFTGLATGCRILTGSDDFTGGGLFGPRVPPELRPVRRGVVTIGRHSVLGANCVVLPDVEVGEGCAVGAGSVVTRDLEPWGIYVGSPARRIRDRPSQKVLLFEKILRDKHG